GCYHRYANESERSDVQPRPLCHWIYLDVDSRALPDISCQMDKGAFFLSGSGVAGQYWWCCFSACSSQCFQSVVGACRRFTRGPELCLRDIWWSFLWLADETRFGRVVTDSMKPELKLKF